MSLIPAAYYADLACERGRCYLNDFLVDDKTSTAGGSTRGRLSKEEEEQQVFDQAKRAWGVGVSRVAFSAGNILTYRLYYSFIPT